MGSPVNGINELSQRRPHCDCGILLNVGTALFWVLQVIMVAEPLITVNINCTYAVKASLTPSDYGGEGRFSLCGFFHCGCVGMIGYVPNVEQSTQALLGMHLL